jgi:hypothetical protein
MICTRDGCGLFRTIPESGETLFRESRLWNSRIPEFRNAWDNDVIDDIMAVRLLVREDAYRGAYSCGSLLTETLIRAGTRLLVHPRHVYITRPQPEGNP